MANADEPTDAAARDPRVRRPRKVIRLADTFTTTLARAGFSLAEFARAADLSVSTFYHLRNYRDTPERKGGMYEVTAWKIVNTFSAQAKISPQEAYDLLLVEEHS